MGMWPGRQAACVTQEGAHWVQRLFLTTIMGSSSSATSGGSIQFNAIAANAEITTV